MTMKNFSPKLLKSMSNTYLPFALIALENCFWIAGTTMKTSSRLITSRKRFQSCNQPKNWMITGQRQKTGQIPQHTWDVRKSITTPVLQPIHRVLEPRVDYGRIQSEGLNFQSRKTKGEKGTRQTITYTHNKNQLVSWSYLLQTKKSKKRLNSVSFCGNCKNVSFSSALKSVAATIVRPVVFFYL